VIGGADRSQSGGPSDRSDGPSGSKPFDPLGAFRVLQRHGVRFIVIGGIAAGLHGSPSLTADLDICYARSEPNLEALASALTEIHARLRGVPSDLPFQLDARALRLGDSFTLSTDVGGLDCFATPTGTGGYADLDRQAEEFDVGGLVVRVASIGDLIRMKRATGRPKDRVELEILGALQDEIDRHP
jgi:hypothetical protein